MDYREPDTHNTADGRGLIDDMVEEWGAQFQRLSNTERLWMITKLAEDLWAGEPEENDITEAVEIAVERSNAELSIGDRLNLVETLVHQVKSSQHS